MAPAQFAAFFFLSCGVNASQKKEFIAGYVAEETVTNAPIVLFLLRNYFPVTAASRQGVIHVKMKVVVITSQDLCPQWTLLSLEKK